MADDDEIVVSLPPEFDIDDGATVVKVEPVKKAEQVDDPIADLKGQFATLQSSHQQVAQRATQAEHRATQAEQQLAESRKDVVASQLDTVTSGLEAAESEAKAAEQAYTVAFEAGDGAAMARAQRSIAKAEARIGRLQEAEADLKDQSTTTKSPVREQPQQRTAPVDPVDRFTANMAPRAAAWVRSHPECVTDTAKNDAMMKTHYKALADGLTEGGDEYFAMLDDMAAAGYVKPSAAKREAVKDDTTTTTTQRRPSAPVAPANGSGGGGAGGTTVTLSRGEVESATDGSIVHNFDDPKGKFKKNEPIGVQEFARRKAIMQKQGLYDKTLTT